MRRLIPATIRKEEAISRRLCAFYTNLKAALGHCGKALKAGGYAVYVIANNVIRGKRVEANRILAEADRTLL
ncbi:MAG TPA: hypothetical protein VH682_15135 [Gemmataceae bacterium]